MMSTFFQFSIKKLTYLTVILLLMEDAEENRNIYLLLTLCFIGYVNDFDPNNQATSSRKERRNS